MTTRHESLLDVESVAISIGTVVATLQMAIECLPQDGRYVGEIPDVLALCRDHLLGQQRELEQIAEGLDKPPLKAVQS